MADRSTQDVINRVLDGLFGYAKGSLSEIPDTRSKAYKDDLQLLQDAGISKEQLTRLMEFAKTSQQSRQMIQAKHNIVGNQQPIIRNPKEVSDIRSQFLTKHTKESLANLEKVVNKYSESAVKGSGYFSRYKQVASSPAKLKDILNKPGIASTNTFARPFREFGAQTGVIYSGAAHTVRMIKDLENYAKSMDKYRTQIQSSRTRGGQNWSVGPMLGRISGVGSTKPATSSWSSVANMLSSIGGRSSSPYKMAGVSPSNMVVDTSVSRNAQEMVREIQKRQALSNIKAPPTGFLDQVKALAHENYPRVIGTPTVTRKQSDSWMVRNKDKLLEALIGVGGTAGLLGVTAGALGGFMLHGIPMPFKMGGSIPKYNEGSDYSITHIPGKSRSPELMDLLKKLYENRDPNDLDTGNYFMNTVIGGPSSFDRFVAHRGNTPMSALSLILNDQGKSSYVALAGTGKNYRGMGLGTSLYEKAEELARGAGKEDIRLEAVSSHAADFWNKRGFEQYGAGLMPLMRKRLLASGGSVPNDLVTLFRAQPRGFYDKLKGMDPSAFTGKESLTGEWFDESMRGAVWVGDAISRDKARDIEVRKIQVAKDIAERMKVANLPEDERGLLAKVMSQRHDQEFIVPRDMAMNESKLVPRKLWTKLSVHPGAKALGGSIPKFAMGTIDPFKILNFKGNKFGNNFNSLKRESSEYDIRNDFGLFDIGELDAIMSERVSPLNYDEVQELRRKHLKPDADEAFNEIYAESFYRGKHGYEIADYLRGKNDSPNIHKSLKNYFGNSISDVISGLDRFPKIYNNQIASLEPLRSSWLYRGISDPDIVNRVLSGGRYPIIPSDPSYQFMSLDPAISRKFAKNRGDVGMVIASKLGNKLINNIGYRGNNEMEFRTSRDIGWRTYTHMFDRDENIHYMQALPFFGDNGPLFNPVNPKIKQSIKFLSSGGISGYASGGKYVPYGGNPDMPNLLAKMATMKSFKRPSSIEELAYAAEHGGANGVLDPDAIKRILMPKKAMGGALSNPIRVSDGELAISRGMTDSIGLDTLRKLNMGDMSPLMNGFSKGGFMEYDGPGSGTSDSILEDADKGPRGSDASDIGFIIKRTSSDKIKSLLGGGLSKIKGVGKYAMGGPIGYGIGGSILGSAKILYNQMFGDKNVYGAYQDTILKDLQSKYVKGQKFKYILDKNSSDAFKENMRGMIRELPPDLKKALSAANKPIKFSDDPSFGGKFNKSYSMGIGGRFIKGRDSDSIYLNQSLIPSLFSSKKNTLYHELMHSAFFSASQNARKAFTSSIKDMGYPIGKTPLTNPTEIASFSSRIPARKGMFDSLRSMMPKFATGGNILGSSLKLDTLGKIGDVLNPRKALHLSENDLTYKSNKPTRSSLDLSNPIRVSDGELAISRGMTDSIGLDTLRKLNMGDMSPLMNGFSKGGFMEYDGPGSGTSDSILEDADKGPRGSDASDIGFIIKRTSSDKIKSLLGGGLSKIKGVGKYAMGGPIGYAVGDQVTKGFEGYKDNQYSSGRIFKRVMDIIGSDLLSEQSTVDDIMNAIFADKKFKQILDSNSSATKGSKRRYDYGESVKGALQSAFSNVMDVNQDQVDLKNNKDALNKETEAVKNAADAQNDFAETTRKLTGNYRGQLRLKPGAWKIGDPRASNVFGMDLYKQQNPDYLPGAELSSEGEISKSLGFFRRKLTGFWTDFSNEMFNPTAQQVITQGTVTRPIGTTNPYSTPEELAQYEANRKEFNIEQDRITRELTQALGPVIGEKRVRQNLEVLPSISQVERQVLTGYGSDKKPIYETRTEDIGTINVSLKVPLPTLQKMGRRPEEIQRIIETVSGPSAQSAKGLIGKGAAPDGSIMDVSLVEQSTQKWGQFNEQVARTAHNNTILYKMGDILRGISWRFASLSMSAMGVYFSIQGLLMTFQQGVNSIVGPLSDIDTLMKSIGMSAAFGRGIYNAKNAMDDMNLTNKDFIEGWKQVTNLQATIQTFFAGIGAKVFGDAGNNSEMLKKVSDAFKVLGSDDSIKTYKDLLMAVAEALPAIVPALKTITSILQVIADNKWIVTWGAYLMVLALALQPIMSGLAAVVTILGGLSTGINLVLTLSNALGVAAGATAGLSASLVGLVAISAAVLITWEAIARVWEYLSKSEINLKPSSMIMNWVGGKGLLGTQPQGFANGGTVQSEGYDMVPNSPDDTVITAKSGEIVIDPKKRQHFFNTTGYVGPSASMSPIESTFQFNTNKDLSTINNRNTGKMSQVLGDVQNGNTLNVTVTNWPDGIGKQGEGGEGFSLPFDIGFPSVNEWGGGLAAIKNPVVGALRRAMDFRDKGIDVKDTDKFPRDEGVKDEPKSLWERFKDRLKSTWDRIKERLGDVWKRVKDRLKEVKERIFGREDRISVEDLDKLKEEWGKTGKFDTERLKDVGIEQTGTEFKDIKSGKALSFDEVSKKYFKTETPSAKDSIIKSIKDRAAKSYELLSNNKYASRAGSGLKDFGAGSLGMLLSYAPLIGLVDYAKTGNRDEFLTGTAGAAVMGGGLNVANTAAMRYAGRYAGFRGAAAVGGRTLATYTGARVLTGAAGLFSPEMIFSSIISDAAQTRKAYLEQKKSLNQLLRGDTLNLGNELTSFGIGQRFSARGLMQMQSSANLTDEQAYGVISATSAAQGLNPMLGFLKAQGVAIETLSDPAIKLAQRVPIVGDVVSGGILLLKNMFVGLTSANGLDVLSTTIGGISAAYDLVTDRGFQESLINVATQRPIDTIAGAANYAINSVNGTSQYPSWVTDHSQWQWGPTKNEMIGQQMEKFVAQVSHPMESIGPNASNIGNLRYVLNTTDLLQSQQQVMSTQSTSLLSNGMPNTESGWWKQGSLASGKIQYYEDPNGNKYGFNSEYMGSAQQSFKMNGELSNVVSPTAQNQQPNAQTQQTTSQPITINATIQVSGEELATKGSVTKQIVIEGTELWNALTRQNQSRIVGNK